MLVWNNGCRNDAWLALVIAALLAWYRDQAPLAQFNLFMLVVLVITIMIKTTIVIVGLLHVTTF
jgi:hypothetical protein